MFFTRKNKAPTVVILGGDTNAHLSRIARQLAYITGQLEQLNSHFQPVNTESRASGVISTPVDRIYMPKGSAAEIVKEVLKDGVERHISEIFRLASPLAQERYGLPWTEAGVGATCARLADIAQLLRGKSGRYRLPVAPEGQA